MAKGNQGAKVGSRFTFLALGPHFRRSAPNFIFGVGALVIFNNFRTLDPETSDLARELIYANSDQRSAFSSFMCLWMAFNGWMECVTDAANDAEMIAVLADHQRLASAFEMLLRDSAEFRAKVEAFTNMCPVLSVRDVRRKLGRDAFLRYTQEQLRDEVLKRGIKYQPTDYLGGALNWPQLLRTIYLVRCNLFHGSKSPQNSRDHQLVVACDQVLRFFIADTGCFMWSD